MNDTQKKFVELLGDRSIEELIMLTKHLSDKRLALQLYISYLTYRDFRENYGCNKTIVREYKVKIDILFAELQRRLIESGEDKINGDDIFVYNKER